METTASRWRHGSEARNTKRSSWITFFSDNKTADSVIKEEKFTVESSLLTNDTLVCIFNTLGFFEDLIIKETPVKNFRI